jgi:hypothetical protein
VRRSRPLGDFMKALLVLVVMAAGCGNDPCANADGHLDDLGICLIHSSGQNIISVDELNRRMVREVEIFNLWDDHPHDTIGLAKNYFEEKGLRVVFDSNMVMADHVGTYHSGNETWIAIDTGMGRCDTYYVIVHEMMHALHDRWYGGAGPGHPYPYFDESSTHGGWDTAIFECVYWSPDKAAIDCARP